MVWIISRHYNSDERMVPLMERIAWELAERVYRVIVFRTLFEYVYNFISPFLVEERKKTNNHTINNKKQLN